MWYLVYFSYFGGEGGRLSACSKIERDSVARFFCFRFFHESSSPKPLKITLETFQIFLKFRRDIHSQGAPPVSMTQGANLVPVSTTAAENLPPVSTTPVAKNINSIRLITPKSELQEKYFI
jgi:hypothetical protein